MPAPTFIQEMETTWNISGNRTTGSFTVQSADVLVAYAVVENHYTNISVGNSGTAFVWTERQQVNVTDYCRVYVWTASASVGQGMTVTFTAGGTLYYSGANVLTFRASDGVGASAKTNVASGAPTLNLTTTQANSAIVVANGDWAAVDGASRTWRANAGTLTEQTYYRDSLHYAVYGGYHADAGAVGTYAVGLSTPAGQKYSIAAVEVKGTAGGATTTPQQQITTVQQAVKRAWTR